MPKRILIVEDNIVILTMQKQIFEMEGYEIITAQEGMDALKKLHEEIPDVVLLDVNIPGMNGFELCRQIKEEPTLQDIIVVMISAVYYSDEDAKKGMAMGADAYFTKPYENEVLQSKIKELIENRDGKQ
ncbi:MAG: response regulator [bacterium]|nr:response regulator [bacterium]MDT8364920.1 response regulator [bacterium]